MITRVRVSPSLALIKYWGKIPGGTNLPATPSLAVTLGGLSTTTRVRVLPEEAPSDQIEIDGQWVPVEKYLPVIDAIRSRLGSSKRVQVKSRNDFPTSAGLASSSSGFAALTLAVHGALGGSLSTADLSGIARLGSGSASRALFGGYTIWPASGKVAEPFLPGSHWPELRVLAVVVDPGPKPVGSREAMERSRQTSLLYPQWVENSQELFSRAKEALIQRDLDGLGAAMQESYLTMFSTMFTSRPPVFYWQPGSVEVIRLCQELRDDRIAAWETMDAGPQVKIVTTASDAPGVIDRIGTRMPGLRILEAFPGGDPEVWQETGEL